MSLSPGVPFKLPMYGEFKYLGCRLLSLGIPLCTLDIYVEVTPGTEPHFGIFRLVGPGAELISGEEFIGAIVREDGLSFALYARKEEV